MNKYDVVDMVLAYMSYDFPQIADMNREDALEELEGCGSIDLVPILKKILRECKEYEYVL